MDESRASEVDHEDLDSKRFLDANKSDKVRHLSNNAITNRTSSGRYLRRNDNCHGHAANPSRRSKNLGQNQLTALKLKRSQNESLLNWHREVEARRAGLQETIDLEIAILNNREELIRRTEHDDMGIGLRLFMERSFVEMRQKIADRQDFIDRLDSVSPLSND